MKKKRKETSEKSRRKTPKAYVYILAVLVGIAGLYLLQRLLMPKYVDGVIEGAFIGEYYKEENKDFDVIFIGDCEIYENFSPAVLWTEYGINSYIRGSPEQYIMQSYYMIEDTLRYNTPDVIVFNIQSLQYNEAQKEPFNRMTLDGMEWSPVKVKAILASMKPGEHFLDYLFPLLRFHTRWNSLRSTDFKYLFSADTVSHNGYFLRADTMAPQYIPEKVPLDNYQFGDNAWKYLDMMVDLCKENNIQLLLVKAPSLYPYWYEQWNQQVVDYAAKNNLPYINFYDLISEIGIDYNTDTYDGGEHMNIRGAEKLSLWLGKYLIRYFGVPDRRQDDDLNQIWNQKIELYNNAIIEQCEKFHLNFDELKPYLL